MVTPIDKNVPLEWRPICPMTDKIVVFSTCGSADEAEQLARRLVEKHLAACVNVISPVRSFYRWKGAVEDSTEWLLMIKSSRPLFAALRAVLEAAHSYEVPEVIAVPVVEGSPNYLSWIEQELLPAEID
jgi:periplasmic divalent cation tolerance protein